MIHKVLLNERISPACLKHMNVVALNPQPDLTHRLAKCCKESTIIPSNTDLPYFEWKSKDHYDRYVCDECGGW
jgi:hypothetical protein